MEGSNDRRIGEMFMILKDRRRLARLMVIQEVSHRELARAAGWKSHTYVGRLLRGEAKTLETDPALRIANHLRVAVDDLFLVRVTSNPVGSQQKNSPTAA